MVLNFDRRGKFLKKVNLLPPWLHTLVLLLIRFHNQVYHGFYVPGSSILLLQWIIYIFTSLKKGICLQAFSTQFPLLWMTSLISKLRNGSSSKISIGNSLHFNCLISSTINFSLSFYSNPVSICHHQLTVNFERNLLISGQLKLRVVHVITNYWGNYV